MARSDLSPFTSAWLEALAFKVSQWARKSLITPSNIDTIEVERDDSC